jgi:phage terminase large subunit-like protein
MTDTERLEALKQLEATELSLQKQMEELKQGDPFYWYEPSNGVISSEAKAYLEEFLQPDDIPQRCDSQLDAHLCTAETIANFGGNQGGKTTWLVIEALIHATGELPHSLKDIYPREKLAAENMRYLRLEGESDTQLDVVLIPALRYWVPRDYLIGRSWDQSYSAKSRVLILQKNGRECAKIYLNTFTQDVSKLQGNKLTFVGYDEEPPQAHRKENLFRFATAKRLAERFSMTPTKGLTWVKEEILDKQGPTVRAFKMASVVNRYANLSVLRTIVSKLTSYAEKKMRLLGEFVSLSGLIYGGLFNRSIHMIKPFPVGCNCEKIKSEGEHHNSCPHRLFMIVRGADIHTVTAPAMVEMAIQQHGPLLVCGVYNPPQCPDIEDIKLDWANRVEDRGYRLRWTIVDKSLDYDMKAAANLNLYKKLIRGNNRVRPCYKSEKFSGSIMVGVDELKQLLKVDPVSKTPGILFFDTPEVQTLVNDIETLERDTYRDEDKKGQKDQILEGKKHRHAALRYITQRKLTWKPLEEPHYVAPEEDEAYI